MTEPNHAIPPGYRPALVTAITVILAFSLYFFRFWGFEADGEWTVFSIVAAFVMFVAIVVQAFALWRSLQLADDRPESYETTVSWFMAGIGLALISVTLAVLAYPGALANP